MIQKSPGNNTSYNLDHIPVLYTKLDRRLAQHLLSVAVAINFILPQPRTHLAVSMFSAAEVDPTHLPDVPANILQGRRYIPHPAEPEEDYFFRYERREKEYWSCISCVSERWLREEEDEDEPRDEARWMNVSLPPGNQEVS